MEEKRRVMAQLDAAIDAMDLEAIDRELEKLSPLEEPLPLLEDPKEFAARIQQLNKERQPMQKPKISLRIAIAVAAIALLGVGVYAANAMNLFTFVSGDQDQVITMRTTESMTEQEARDFVQEDMTAEAPPEAQAGSPESASFTFDSVEQAEGEMDIKLILPSAMPEMTLNGATGQTLSFGDHLETRTVWLDYSDEAGRLFGITTTREVAAPGAAVTGYTTNEMDPGSGGTYRSKSGAEYATLTESDETGEKTAHLAVATVGEYEYVLVFMGFDQAEREAIIDSADLSAYGVS